MRLSTVLLMALAPTLPGCDIGADKFQLVRAGEQTYLLNRSTGDLKSLNGATYERIAERVQQQPDESIRQMKAWPDLSFSYLPKVKFRMRTKYRDGAMLWKVEAAPFQGDLEREYQAAVSDPLRKPVVWIELFDADEFKTGSSLEVLLRRGTRLIGESGEVQALVWSGSMEMTAEAYRDARAANLRWNDFTKN